MGHEVQYKKMSNYVHRQWKSHPTYLYNLCGHVSSVQIAKYLGITLTDELSWSSRVHSIHSRANSTLGFLRRNLRRCPAKLKETAYITLVRSTLQYAASNWDPHLAKDCDLLKLQRRSARFVKGDYRTTFSVSQMLHDLGWCDLKDRRRDLRLALLYKIVTGHVQIRLVWWLRTTGPEQIIDTNSGQYI